MKKKPYEEAKEILKHAKKQKMVEIPIKGIIKDKKIIWSTKKQEKKQ